MCKREAYHLQNSYDDPFCEVNNYQLIFINLKFHKSDMLNSFEVALSSYPTFLRQDSNTHL